MASDASIAGSAAGIGRAASWVAILPSTSAAWASALFQRASSSAVTRRFRARYGAPVKSIKNHAIEAGMTVTEALSMRAERRGRRMHTNVGIAQVATSPPTIPEPRSLKEVR